MKKSKLDLYSVKELSFDDKKSINGGMAAAVGAGALAAKIGCGLLVLGAGVVVGAAACYGAYRLIKWAMS